MQEHEQNLEYEELEKLYLAAKAAMFVDHVNHREFLYKGWVYEFGWRSPTSNTDVGKWALVQKYKEKGQIINACYQRGNPEIAGHWEPCILFSYKGWFCPQGTFAMARTDQQINAGVDIDSINILELSFLATPIRTIDQLVAKVNMWMRCESPFI